MTIKKLTQAVGCAAWSVALKHGKEFYPCYFKLRNRLIAHYGKTYQEGQYGDLGFTNEAARRANENRGVFQERQNKS